ncbi:MAG TPA: hypothetical protein QGF35_00935 [Dehalococcoidia bacterium]|nr:hypothetical protein [Dehalococcoidia bacterium]
MKVRCGRESGGPHVLVDWPETRVGEDGRAILLANAPEVDSLCSNLFDGELVVGQEITITFANEHNSSPPFHVSEPGPSPLRAGPSYSG